MSEQELRESILTTCRMDLSCTHDFFTEHFKQGIERVTIRFEPRTKMLIYVRIK